MFINSTKSECVDLRSLQNDRAVSEGTIAHFYYVKTIVGV